MTEPVSTANAEKPACPHRWKKIGLIFSSLGLLVVICAFMYGYIQLANINIALAKRVTGLQVRTNTLQQTITSIQQASQKNQDLSKEQEQLLADWKAAQQGDLVQWRVAEAQYLVKLANDHLQFSQDFSMATLLLQRADQVLENVTDPNLVNLRQSLATDIAHLHRVPQINTTDIYLQLSTLNTQLDQLPLPEKPLPTDTSAMSALPSDLPWWKWGIERSWEALRKIVVVRYNATNNLPLVLPEEKVFLYQNLHAQMEQAMWAVLNHNAPVYQASLARASMWVSTYFVPDATETKVVLQHLTELQKVNLQEPAANLADTLQLFDTYLAAKH